MYLIFAACRVQFEKRIVEKQRQLCGDSLSLILPSAATNPADAGQRSVPKPISCARTSQGAAEAAQGEKSVLDSNPVDYIPSMDVKLPLKRARSDPGGLQ
jgi:hypothetical protein